MIPVAIVLLVLLLLFAAGAIVSNADPVVLNVFVAQIPTNLAVVFIIGMVTALAFVAAFALLGLGVRRQRATTKVPRSSADGTGAKATRTKESKPLKDKDAKPLKDKGGDASIAPKRSGAEDAGSTEAVKNRDRGPA